MPFKILWRTPDGRQIWHEYEFRPLWASSLDEYRLHVIMCGLEHHLVCLEAPEPGGPYPA